MALLVGCDGSRARGDDGEPDRVDAVEPPTLGACRDLTPADVAQSSNATATVPCSRAHTAQTYVVGALPSSLVNAGYDSRALGAWAYRTCSARLMRFLGADESLLMRSVLSWAWFRPSRSAWDAGARWYRCDVVGGGDQSREYADLPTSVRGQLLGKEDDDWMVCASGRTVAGSVKIPCSQPHAWRAVTTIVLGEKDDPYPGDRLVEVRTHDYCSDSVGAWLGYPASYSLGFTWFHRAEWEAGNRRSVCWAETDR
nr:septum formation family protein [Nocardioides panaciterrulae]